MGRGVPWRRAGQSDGDWGYQSRQLPDTVSGKPLLSFKALIESLKRCFNFNALVQERPGCNYFAWVNSEHEVTGYRLVLSWIVKFDQIQIYSEIEYASNTEYHVYSVLEKWPNSTIWRLLFKYEYQISLFGPNYSISRIICDNTGCRNTCWLKSSPGTAQSCSTCVSGPRECEGGSECCTVVTVSSSGDTGVWSATRGWHLMMCDAGDYQWNRLGVFQYQYDAPDGRPVYFKVRRNSEWSIIQVMKLFQEKDSQWLYFVQYPYVWWVTKPHPK